MKAQHYLSLGILALISASLISCNKEGISGKESQEDILPGNSLSINQAEKLVNLFLPLLEQNVKPDVETRATASPTEKVLKNIDVYVEDGDTLIYAFNYAEDGGYILIGADETTFPILSHSSHGNFEFTNIDAASPVNAFLEAYKEKIKTGLNSVDMPSELHDKWKDLGKEGYEYEVEICPIDELIETRARRTRSSEKTSIYPYTGKELEYWCQKGGYNYYADNQACIGCPAIAIGMLLYDTSERVLGNGTQTSPSFSYYYDAYDIQDKTTGTETARKLREIADAIPDYEWGVTKDAGSGASPAKILTGLHNLGYTEAMLEDFNFETLYSNLTFKGYNYLGEETDFSRGVLLGGYSSNGSGHIWFCDGYYEQGYTVKKKFLGITIDKWNEYDDRLYMNWGYGKDQGNGWYCATDNGYWSSLSSDTGLTIDLKYLPKMYINLSHYEMPSNN